MKLFGTHKSDEAENALPADTAMTEAAPSPLTEPKRLVLDIEGLEKEIEPEDAPALKAETKELPTQKELLLAELRRSEEGEAEPEAPEAPAQTPRAEPAREAEDKTEREPAQAPEEKSGAEAPGAPKPEPVLSSVTYASVAEAVETAKKEPTGRFSRDAVDDETLLAELYALIGEPGKKRDPVPASAAPTGQPVSKPAAVRPVARITPEDLQATPDPEELPEEDSVGVPGWLKGVFLLLISLLLSAMTFYAVASDVIGKLF